MIKSNTVFPSIACNCVCGCLKHDTKVTMADGTQRFISEVRPGDMVIARQDDEVRPASVRNIWQGHEETICQIDMANGKTIWATKNHPFLTRKRIKTAEELQEGSLLLSEDGQEWIEVLQQKEMADSTEVYNLDLDPEDSSYSVFFLAEGVWVGDNLTQNKRHW